MVKKYNKDFTFELKQYGRQFTLTEGKLAPSSSSPGKEDYIRSIISDLSKLVMGPYAQCIINFGIFILLMVLLVSCIFPLLIIFLFPILPIHWALPSLGTLCGLCCCLCFSFYLIGHEASYVTLPESKFKLDQYLEANKATITE